MIVYRLAKQAYATLDGEGARLYPGRWNTSMHPVVYTSSGSSLAILEVLVNVNSYHRLFLEPYVMITLEVPDEKLVDLRADVDLIFGVKKYPVRESQRKGSELFDDIEVLGIIVPSIVNPIETNIVLNASAFNLEKFKVSEEVFDFDGRFMK